MAVFEVTSPDGRTFDVEGDNAPGALAALLKHLGSTPPAAAPTQPSPGAMFFGEEPDMAALARQQPVQASMPYGEQMRNVGGVLDKGARMATNGLTAGMADRFAGGMDALIGRAPSYSAGVDAQHATTEAVQQANPVAAGMAEAAGGVLSGAGLMKSGITLAGRVGSGLLPRVLGYGAEGAAYGAAHGAGNTYSERIADYIANAKGGATSGALVGGGAAMAGAAAGGLYRLGASFVGPSVEGMGRGASAMMRRAAQADEAGLQALPDMGPQAMLVDAGPAMKGLGQGAATGTGQGKSDLVNTLVARDRGTGPRLAEALDTNLGPAPIPSRVEAGLADARQALGPEYQRVVQGAPRVDMRPLAQQLDAVANVERGPGQRAAQQVRAMIGGAAHQTEPAVLLNTRQAIDGMIASETDPNTIRILDGSRRAVDEALAQAVPGIKEVDAQFAELARQSSGLQRGSQTLDGGKTAIRPVEMADEMQQGALPQGLQIGPSAVPMRIQQGTRAELDRLVGTNVNDLGKLERTIGTPQDWNSQKLETIFGEGPVAKVAKALMDNRAFRQSYQDIVQGSQTAPRAAAAAEMEGSAGGNVPHDVTMTGMGLKAVSLVAKAISGASSARTKDEIGQVLATQGPAVQRIARELLQSAKQTGDNADAINRVLSSPYWIYSTAPAAGRKSTQ